MNRAGDYKLNFQWWVYSAEKDTSTGQDKQQFTQQSSNLWGAIEYLTGSVDTDYGAPQGTTTATIRIRQWIPVSVMDRLVNTRFSETWIVDGTRRNINPPETILDVHAFETLTLPMTPTND